MESDTENELVVVSYNDDCEKPKHSNKQAESNKPQPQLNQEGDRFVC